MPLDSAREMGQVPIFCYLPFLVSALINLH